MICVGIVFGLTILNPAASLQLPDGAVLGDLRDEFICQSCEAYTNRLRRYKLEHGWPDNNCDRGDAGYKNLIKGLVEDVLFAYTQYIPDVASAEEAKLHFLKTCGGMEELVCAGVSTAEICRYYDYCGCLGGSYAFGYEEDTFYQRAVCLKCPEGQMSLTNGDNAITSCYKPANTGFNDSTGSWVFTENCHWKN